MSVGSKTLTRESRWIDQALVWGLTTTTLFALGQALQIQTFSYMMIGLATLGTLVSYFGFVIGSTGDRRGVDGLFQVMAGSSVIIFSGFFLNLAPPGTFEGSLRVPGVLTWFVTLATFFQWTDATRMFQAVPCIAMFGLLGVYDTFGGAVFAFFIFLFFLAWLFSRTHSRAMLQFAFESGFSRIDEGTSLRKEQLQQDALLKAMRRGPWKMMAGPEWALLSAAAIVGISLFGSPIIAASVSSVTGHVQVILPKKLRQRASNYAGTSAPATYQQIGIGPARLSDHVIGVVSSQVGDYLQQQSFSLYTGNEWQQDGAESGVAIDGSGRRLEAVTPASQELFQSDQNAIVSPQSRPFTVTLFDESIQRVPIPPTLLSIQIPSHVDVFGDGGVQMRLQNYFNLQFMGNYIKSGIRPGSSQDPACLTAYPDNDGVNTTERVRNLVEQITKGLPNDWAKAEAIKHAIAARCKYDVGTPAYPPGKDAVDYFLFTAKRGYCEMFASAMAVMARCAGIKANYSVGYLVDPSDRDAQGNLRIRENDAHAWANLKFHDVGWVVFDATEGAQDVSSTDQFGKSSSTILLLSSAFGIVCVLGGLAVYFWRKLNLKLPTFKKRDRTRILTQAAFEQFCKEVEKKSKMARSPNQTITEYTSGAAAACGAIEQEIIELGKEFEAIFYDSQAIDLQKVTQLNGRIAKVKQSKTKASVR